MDGDRVFWSPRSTPAMEKDASRSQPFLTAMACPRGARCTKYCVLLPFKAKISQAGAGAVQSVKDAC